MSGIEGIDQIAGAAARIEIEKPQTSEAAEIMAAVADARADLPKREPAAFVNVDTGEVVEVNEAGGTANLQSLRQTEAFDSAAYVAVPEIDNQAADQIIIAFTGSVAYDATDEQGAKLYQDLKLGKAVEMRVAGFVSGKAGGYKVTAREEEVVTGKATVRVDTLYLLTPESL